MFIFNVMIYFFYFYPRIPELLDWLKMLQKNMHNPPLLDTPGEEQTKIIVTNGSQDGLSKVFLHCIDCSLHIWGRCWKDFNPFITGLKFFLHSRLYMYALNSDNPVIKSNIKLLFDTLHPHYISCVHKRSWI